MKTNLLLIIIISVALAQNPAPAMPTEIRFGATAFGTVNWELATIARAGLDEVYNIKLKHYPLANPQAGKIALQAKAVDMIVSDWIWVSRQRVAGFDYTFTPYSSTAGALVVPRDSAIQSVKDLEIKRLGIAGGGLDKNWLLLRAFAQMKFGLDLDRSVQKVFGAPPLLNNQMLQGNLDALINYWHYAARLETQGYRKLLDAQDILRGLGITSDVPNLGFVFRDSWASANRAIVLGFLAASRDAKNLLCTDDDIWKSIVVPRSPDNRATQNLLRQRYCAGRIRSWTEREKQGAASIFKLLSKFGGRKLTGNSSQLQTGTFWNYSIPAGSP